MPRSLFEQQLLMQTTGDTSVAWINDFSHTLMPTGRDDRTLGRQLCYLLVELAKPEVSRKVVSLLSYLIPSSLRGKVTHLCDMSPLA